MSVSHASSSFPSGYSVSMFQNGTHMFSSDAFQTRNEAEDFLEQCRSMDTNNMMFQVYKFSPRGQPEYNDCSHHLDGYDNEVQHQHQYSTSTTDLTSMTLEAYKRGYLLRTHQNDPRTGTKEFMGGFWNKTLDGWVFRKCHCDMLIAYGASLINDEDEDEHDAQTDEHYDENGNHTLHHLKVKGVLMEKYGKGYMLYPKPAHPYYGQQYFHEGWWNNKAKGWFFRSQYFDELIAAGVKYHA